MGKPAVYLKFQWNTKINIPVSPRRPIYSQDTLPCISSERSHFWEMCSFLWIWNSVQSEAVNQWTANLMFQSHQKEDAFVPLKIPSASGSHHKISPLPGERLLQNLETSILSNFFYTDHEVEEEEHRHTFIVPDVITLCVEETRIKVQQLNWRIFGLRKRHHLVWLIYLKGITTSLIW